MTLKSGTRLGRYEILSLLGAGGMGEVYRARDTQLQRVVALKILSGGSPARLEIGERFRREAQTLASLNHPHICSIFDVGSENGFDYIVMELLEGQTLSERLEKGPLSVDEGLQIAIDVTDALDKAHRQGIVHRDLKPSNVMLTPHGAKLMDFGLAKLRSGIQPAGPAEGPTRDDLTAEGTIVGTLQYMAPEQLEGAEIDARTDIFSLGALLYETFGGGKAFEGNSKASLIAGIMNAAVPPLSHRQPTVPSALDHLIAGCLSRDVTERWQSAHDVLKQLRWIRSSAPPAEKSEARADKRSRLAFSVAVVFIVAIGIAVALSRPARNRLTVSQPARLAVAMPNKVSLALGESSPSSAALSPDGSRMVFRGVNRETGKVALYVRPIDSVDMKLLPGTDEGSAPFWSPNSKSVAFFAQGKLLRIDVDGGTPREICAASVNGYGTWNQEDIIVAGMTDAGVLSTVSANGGTPVAITTLSADSKITHNWPHFLPDGKHFLYTSVNGLTGQGEIVVGALDSAETKVVTNGVSGPTVFDGKGHILFLQKGALVAQPFDMRSFQTSGMPVVVADRAATPFSISKNGTVMYRNRVSAPDRMIWIGWDGREIGPALESGYYDDPAISPDGSKLAFAKRESDSASQDVWVLDLETGMQRRMTSDPADDRAPVWSPDSSEIAFWSKRPSGPGLYRKKANGVGDEVLVVADKTDIWPYQWSWDARYLVYFGGAGIPSYDISMFDLKEQKIVPLIHTSSVDADGAVSPDGKWFAYEDNHAGRYEVYLTTFPPSSTQISVTNESGVDSLWSADGKKLFYVNSVTGELLSMDVKVGNPPQFGSPKRLYPGQLNWTSAHSFDIDTRRQRVLVQTSTLQNSEITVLLNWQP